MIAGSLVRPRLVGSSSGAYQQLLALHNGRRAECMNECMENLLDGNVCPCECEAAALLPCSDHQPSVVCVFNTLMLSISAVQGRAFRACISLALAGAEATRVIR